MTTIKTNISWYYVKSLHLLLKKQTDDFICLNEAGDYYLHQFPIIDDLMIRGLKRIVYLLNFMLENPNLRIEKFDEFLNSDIMKKRLLCNLLATNHEVFGKDISDLSLLAASKLVEYIFLASDYEYLTIDNIVNDICVSKQTGFEYKEFLGFSIERHGRYLNQRIKSTLKHLFDR